MEASDNVVGCVLPPHGNTGGNQTGQSIKCDTLRGTVTRDRLEPVLSLLEGVWGKSEKRDVGPKGYSEGLWFPVDGMIVGLAENRGEALLVLPGKALERIDGRGFLDLVHFLALHAFNCTRFDAALDDFDGVIPLDQVRRAGDQGNYIGFRNHHPWGRNTAGQVTGHTDYFGERGKNGSGKLVRFYDKTMESDGEVRGQAHNCVRYEVEFNKVGKRSQMLFADVAACQDVEEMTRCIGRALGGAIDFKDRGGCFNGNTSRMPRLSWWVPIVELLGVVKYKPLRSKTKLLQTAEWVEKSVLKPLVKLRRAMDQKGYSGMQTIRLMLERAEAEMQGEKLKDLGKELPDWWVRKNQARTSRGPRFSGSGRPGTALGKVVSDV